MLSYLISSSLDPPHQRVVKIGSFTVQTAIIPIPAHFFGPSIGGSIGVYPIYNYKFRCDPEFRALGRFEGQQLRTFIHRRLTE